MKNFEDNIFEIPGNVREMSEKQHQAAIKKNKWNQYETMKKISTCIDEINGTLGNIEFSLSKTSVFKYTPMISIDMKRSFWSSKLC